MAKQLDVQPKDRANTRMATAPHSTALARFLGLSSPGPGGSGTFHLPLWEQTGSLGYMSPHPVLRAVTGPGKTQLGGSGQHRRVACCPARPGSAVAARSHKRWLAGFTAYSAE